MTDFKPLNICNQPIGKYEDDLNLYQNHYIEQYKIYVNRYEKDMDRLLIRERFFLVLNSSFLTGLIFAKNNNLFSIDELILKSVTILAFVLSLIWILTIQSANKLKKSQLLVIRSMENDLPAKPFTSERYETSYEKHKSIIKKLGFLRNTIPILFGILYTIYFIMIIIN